MRMYSVRAREKQKARRRRNEGNPVGRGLKNPAICVHYMDAKNIHSFTLTEVKPCRELFTR